jgi:hypothetical protein
MEERRREARQRSLLGGRIVFDDRRCTLDCTVRNVSPHGAMVVASESFRIPETFDFVIPHRDTAHQARVIWRRGESAGLALSPLDGPSQQKLRVRPQGGRRQERRALSLGY